MVRGPSSVALIRGVESRWAIEVPMQAKQKNEDRSLANLGVMKSILVRVTWMQE